MIYKLISEQEEKESKDSFTFMAPNGVTQMGRRTRLIRIREKEWDEVEPFLQQPTFITLRKAKPV